MKFTKTYGTFLIAFSVGCLLVFAFANLFTKNEPNQELYKVNSSNEIAEMTVYKEPKLEVFESVDNWGKEERYPHKMKLLETGEEFHGDEVKAKSGETWLGLFNENDRFVLKTTKLKIERVFDGISDYGTNNKTGKKVSVNHKNEPIILLKNSGLKKGSVKTLFLGKEYSKMPDDSDVSYYDIVTQIDKGFSKEFELNGNKFVLKMLDGLNEDGQNIFALVLEGLGKRQVLHTVTKAYFDEGYGMAILHWVGDLDNDGIPDFYMSPSVHYNVTNRVLYLSSKSDKDKLLRKVAYFWTTGC